MEEATKETLSDNGSSKRVMYLIVIAAFAFLGIYGYFWFRNTSNLRSEAQAVLERAEAYNIVKSQIEEEKSRCEVFISQQEGDFGSFEYCKQFIEWTNETFNF